MTTPPAIATARILYIVLIIVILLHLARWS